MIKITGYKLCCNFCRKTSSSGGVCIFVRVYVNDANLVVKKEIAHLNEEKCFEALALEITVGLNEKFIIFCVYRSPCSQVSVFLHKLEAALSLILNKNRQVIFCGDVNINLSLKNQLSTNYLNLLYSMGFKCLIMGPTRETSTSKTIIDHMFTNINTDRTEIQIIKNNLSDHHSQLLNITTSQPILTNRPTYYFKRMFSQTNITLFNDLLVRETCWNITDNANIDDNFKNFLKLFNLKFNECFPKKKA